MPPKPPQLEPLSPTHKARLRDNRYAMPPTAAVVRVLYVTLRGVAKVKAEGGKVRIPFDPGSLANLLFLRAGQPIALALCKSVTRDHGDWSVEYTNVQWLNQDPA